MSLRTSWIVGALATELLLIGVVFSHFAFAERILPGVSVAGVTLSGKLPQEAERLLQNRVDQINQIGLFTNGASTNGTSINADPVKLVNDWGIDQAIARAFGFGRISATRSIELAVTTNARYLQEIVTKSDPSFIKPVKQPVFTIDNEEVTIVPGEPGNAIDTDHLTRQLAGLAHKQNKQPIALILKAVPPTPINDEQAVLEGASEIISRPIVIRSQNQTFRVDKKTTASWLAINPNNPGTLAINNETLEGYVSKLAKQINRSAKPREIDPDGIEVSPGQEGRKLDETLAVQNIKTMLALPDGGTVELAVATTPAPEKRVPKPFTPGLYDGKYIDVNLARQTLYQFDGDRLVAEHRVSTGKWSMPTPQGTFSINNKTTRAYSKRYNLYMPYWMSFIGGKYGIHELPEFANGRKEGEAHLGTPVSHGCIRLGVGEAQQVYDWADLGTPVVIRKG